MVQLTRFLLILLRYFRAGKPHSIVARTPFRVRLADIDSYRHMNNARYLAVMDLARMDLILRSGWLRYCRKIRIKPVVVDVNIRYRKELKTGVHYIVESSVSSIEGRKVWCLQRFMVGDAVHAEAHVGMLFLNDKGVTDRGTIHTMVETLNLIPPQETPPLRQAG